MKDYYYILGVTKNATRDEIKKAYRKLSLKFHPDKNADDDGFFEARFKEINEAYECLSDPTRRRQYDASFNSNSYKRNNHQQQQQKKKNNYSGNQHKKKENNGYSRQRSRENEYRYQNSHSYSSGLPEKNWLLKSYSYPVLFSFILSGVGKRVDNSYEIFKRNLPLSNYQNPKHVGYLFHAYKAAIYIPLEISAIAGIIYLFVMAILFTIGAILFVIAAAIVIGILILILGAIFGD